VFQKPIHVATMGKLPEVSSQVQKLIHEAWHENADKRILISG